MRKKGNRPVVELLFQWQGKSHDDTTLLAGPYEGRGVVSTKAREVGEGERGGIRANVDPFLDLRIVGWAQQELEDCEFGARWSKLTSLHLPHGSRSSLWAH